ncbi:hypothetical protein E8F11_11220 [Pseudomonas sp. BN417]|uniref:ATP-binding protein n=1 Tax=Pseudomonas sp. BN417 TaxID=2567890 RepID=UPI00245475DD|nr:ATP-binding protein [Pseudomonas sp. BN417]MDH4555735.1 hypothetical protein [Pseudomonas sp. BN417]
MNADREVKKPVNERIPMIMAGHALESLRDSGHSLSTALGEVIDNSIEAKANEIRIQLDQAQNRQGKKHVHRIAIADDGSGMDQDTLHHYLVIGFSTRYMRTDTIGKYGVGAKLAALNFGRRINVWSRGHAHSPWLHTYFDLDKALKEEEAGEMVGLEAPNQEPIPDDLENLLPSGTGSLVVWSEVDRLEEGRMAANFDELRAELEQELARIFRYFINGGIKIKVNDKELIAHDPLMSMEGTWADHILTRETAGEKRARGTNRALDHFPAKVIGDDEIRVSGGKARLKVTLYPKEVIRKRYLGGDKLAKELRVPDNLGAMSFIRMSREVSYTNVPRILPAGVQDPDRFIGIEVSFSPDLDDYFGIRNVKRGVEPHGELRDKIRGCLERHIPTARKEIDEIWGNAAKEDHDKEGEHSAVLSAVKDVDVTMPKGRAEGPSDSNEVDRVLKELARDVGHKSEEDKNAYVEKVRELPFVIESVDFPGNMFISTQHLANQVIIRLNTRHPFYREMWEPLKEISERDPGAVSGDEAVKAARRTIEALTLLLIAYGKAESMHKNPTDQYSDLTQYWGQFLSTMLKKVKGVI